jgi:hypothetical protein
MLGLQAGLQALPWGKEKSISSFQVYKYIFIPIEAELKSVYNLIAKKYSLFIDSKIDQALSKPRFLETNTPLTSRM